MNISITTITDWANYEYSNDAIASIESYTPKFCALPYSVMEACRVYTIEADKYIKSKGASTMIRVTMLDSDRPLLLEAHEYAKQQTIEFFNNAVKEHDIRYTKYLAGKRVLEFVEVGMERIEAIDDIEAFERWGDNKYYHLTNEAKDTYTHLIEMGVL